MNNGAKIVTIPETATIEEIRDEIRDVKTFYMSLDNKELDKNFKIKSGQFIMCTIFGAGEFAVSLPPSPENDRFHLTVRKVGLGHQCPARAESRRQGGDPRAVWQRVSV